MDSASPGVELEGDAAKAFAALIDYLRDYRDCSDLMSETDKLGVLKKCKATWTGCTRRDSRYAMPNGTLAS